MRQKCELFEDANNNASLLIQSPEWRRQCISDDLGTLQTLSNGGIRTVSRVPGTRVNKKIVSKYMPGIEDAAPQNLREMAPSFPSVPSFVSFHDTRSRAVKLMRTVWAS